MKSMLKYLRVTGHGSATYSQLIQPKTKNSLYMRGRGEEGEYANVAKLMNTGV